MEGWISIHRAIVDNFVSKDKPYNYLAAWVYILMRANFKTRYVLFRKELIEVNRGEFVTSTVKLAEQFGWSRGKVSRFLRILCLNKMISQKTTTRWSKLSITNYDTYQDTRASDGQVTDRRRTGDGQVTDTDNNVNNVKNEKNDNKKQKTTHPAERDAFDLARKIFPGRKRGNDTEFSNFIKKHKDWKTVLPLLGEAINRQLLSRKQTEDRNKNQRVIALIEFIPQWQNLQTWINQRSWEMEVAVNENAPARIDTYKKPGIPECLNCGKLTTTRIEDTPLCNRECYEEYKEDIQKEMKNW